MHVSCRPLAGGHYAAARPALAWSRCWRSRSIVRAAAGSEGMISGERKRRRRRRGMDLESRFKEIAKVAEANGGRIMFAETLEALLRYWYTSGLTDAGNVAHDRDEFRL